MGAYLHIELVQGVDSTLYLARVYVILDALSVANGRIFLLRLEVCLFGEVCSRSREAFHREVVQDECVDVAKPRSARHKNNRWNSRRGATGKIRPLGLDIKFRIIFSERFPLIISSSCLPLGGWNRRWTNFLGALTLATRESKACLIGVAVDVEDICSDRSWSASGAPRSKDEGFGGATKERTMEV